MSPRNFGAICIAVWIVARRFLFPRRPPLPVVGDSAGDRDVSGGGSATAGDSAGDRDVSGGDSDSATSATRADSATRAGGDPDAVGSRREVADVVYDSGGDSPTQTAGDSATPDSATRAGGDRDAVGSRREVADVFYGSGGDSPTQTAGDSATSDSSTPDSATGAGGDRDAVGSRREVADVVYDPSDNDSLAGVTYDTSVKYDTSPEKVANDDDPVQVAEIADVSADAVIASLSEIREAAHNLRQTAGDITTCLRDPWIN